MVQGIEVNVLNKSPDMQIWSLGERVGPKKGLEIIHNYKIMGLEDDFI